MAIVTLDELKALNPGRDDLESDVVGDLTIVKYRGAPPVMHRHGWEHGIEAAIRDFCNRVYSASCAEPNRITLAPVSFDTLAADIGPRLRVIEVDDVKRTAGIIMATGHGNVIIERGHA